MKGLSLTETTVANFVYALTFLVLAILNYQL
jgi:hypothetical protein